MFIKVWFRPFFTLYMRDPSCFPKKVMQFPQTILVVSHKVSWELTQPFFLYFIFSQKKIGVMICTCKRCFLRKTGNERTHTHTLSQETQTTHTVALCQASPPITVGSKNGGGVGRGEETGIPVDQVFIHFLLKFTYTLSFYNSNFNPCMKVLKEGDFIYSVSCGNIKSH